LRLRSSIRARAAAAAASTAAAAPSRAARFSVQIRLIPRRSTERGLSRGRHRDRASGCRALRIRFKSNRFESPLVRAPGVARPSRVRRSTRASIAARVASIRGAASTRRAVPRARPRVFKDFESMNPRDGSGLVDG
jgi:hypothetical protein